jgi:hypothetical protein
VLGVAVALTGCRNQVSVKPDPAAQGAATPEVAHLWWICGSVDLSIGRSTCGGPATLTDPSYSFSISDADYARIAPGTRLALGGERNADAVGYRITGAPAGVPVTPSMFAQLTQTLITGGSITFDTFEADKAATGTYEVVFPGGTASGTFSADFCGRSFLCESVKRLPPPPPIPQPKLR